MLYRHTCPLVLWSQIKKFSVDSYSCQLLVEFLPSPPQSSTVTEGLCLRVTSLLLSQCFCRTLKYHKYL